MSFQRSSPSCFNPLGVLAVARIKNEAKAGRYISNFGGVPAGFFAFILAVSAKSFERCGAPLRRNGFSRDPDLGLPEWCKNGVSPKSTPHFYHPRSLQSLEGQIFPWPCIGYGRWILDSRGISRYWPLGRLHWWLGSWLRVAGLWCVLGGRRVARLWHWLLRVALRRIPRLWVALRCVALRHSLVGHSPWHGTLNLPCTHAGVPLPVEFPG